MEAINNKIYFNNNRTTLIDKAVKETLLDAKTLTDSENVAIHKKQLATMLNCDPEEIYFSSGTSDAIKVGMNAVYESNKHKGKHIITNVTEHFIVLECCEELKQKGASVTYLAVDREGRIDPEALREAIRPDTILVSIMAANNETGVIQPISEIAEICKTHQAVFFSDACQFVGKLRSDLSDLMIDCLAFGSHKMYGSEGIGALYVRRLEKTENIHQYLKDNLKAFIDPGLVRSFEKAAELFNETYWENSAHISKLKNYFEHHLLDIEGLTINGSTRHRLYNTSNLTFPYDKKVSDLLKTFDFAHNLDKPSYVLKAMGLTDVEIRNSYRFSFGKYNTLDEVKLLVEEILKL